MLFRELAIDACSMFAIPSEFISCDPLGFADTNALEWDAESIFSSIWVIVTLVAGATFYYYHTSVKPAPGVEN